MRVGRPQRATEADHGHGRKAGNAFHPGLPLRAERIVLERILNNELLRGASDGLRPGRDAAIGGLWGSSAALAAAALGRLRDTGVLVIAAHLDAADELADDLEVFTGRAAQLLPAWEVDVGTDHLNNEVAGERIRLCNLLAKSPAERDEPVDFVVAPVMALLQPVPSPEALAASRLTLTQGGALAPEELAAWLVDGEFEQVEQVDRPGQFARRGGIVDVFPLASAQPLRVEFFGDDIDSLRRFDLDTQRSVESLTACDLTPVAVGQSVAPDTTTHLLRYLSPETLVCLVEPAEVFENAGRVYDRIHDDLAATGTPSSMHRPEDVLSAVRKFAVAEMHTFVPRGRTDAVDLSVRSLERLNINTAEALGELGELAEVADVCVYCENPAERKRFEELLTESHPKLAGKLQTEIGHIRAGFHWPGERLVVVGHHEVFHRYARRRHVRRVRAGRPIDSLLELSEGEYVVHVAHGIARFEGLRTLETDGRSEEYLRLRFKDNAVLHVPAGQIDLVQRYIGSRQARPTLSKLGGKSWSRQKQRVSEAVRDLAAGMLRTQAMRQAMPGMSYPGGSEWQNRFAEEFPYVETEDQTSSMEQIDRDMGANRPMDRLLCGDVGFGKTELAMRAAFKVAETGRQVAVLVPTTVLAAQHARTFRERFADYPFEIDAISRFRTPREQAEILDRVKRGKIDVLIGTHRLLSEDVNFGDLGLVVIDEEQRFGVEHKEKLKAVRASVDVLTMTATPIPRTLHMALLGLRDISALSTPPLDRRAIHTEVCHYDERLIRESIRRELNRRGQVFFVHNRVMSIEPLAERIRQLVPDARVVVAHGQMREGELESTMLKFVRGEIDVLVCTTIIESGLDIPTANTMIIHDADRFGLSELHQLRGRVGRYKNRAYCYLLLPERRTVTPAAAKRLKAIEEFSELGAGFQIAMRDLEIRGAGNILGKEQSGHIAVVGYQLYCQLLERAVRDLRGEKAPGGVKAHVELGIDAYVPRSYIPSERQRMDVYRRIVRCEGRDDTEQLTRDLTDAYGKVPPAVDTLLSLAEIRVLAGSLGVESIIRMEPDLVFAVRDFTTAEKIFEDAPGSVRLPDEKTAYWRPPPAYWEMPTLLNLLGRRLRRAAGVL